ncbi:hypothetical protein C4D60_Mb01t25520 [Musa balbisiana]|uniref:DUF4228 domain-containing protein n=1 Tax=Musa balbisiana TaxID=52838 RepID=A0A4S8JQE3_MUSBA|nr:hypothetical protein C4D60_Mb01t25520 [Musa balbisiana]
MGNCQAAEAATVVIQHPGGRVERAYWSLTASQVMAANPGHYVAVIIVAPPPSALNSADASSSACHDSGGGRGARVKHLRLLRANDTLHIGHVYRLVSFQDVPREFASKRQVRLSRLLAKPTEMTSSSSTRGNGSGAAPAGGRRRQSRRVFEPVGSPATVEEEAKVATELEEVVRGMIAAETAAATRTTRARAVGAAPARHGRWRPALRSIAEVGS